MGGRTVVTFLTPDQPVMTNMVLNIMLSLCLRPYQVENTSSRPITEVKQLWAALVLGWVTAWEYAVS